MLLFLLAPAWIVSVVLIFSTDGLSEGLGWLLNASVLLAIVVLDRRRPDWRPDWGLTTRVLVGIAALLTGAGVALWIDLVAGGAVAAVGVGLLLPSGLFGAGGETADGGAPTDAAAGT